MTPEQLRRIRDENDRRRRRLIVARMHVSPSEGVVVEVPVGNPELITNGTFDTDTTGWTLGSMTGDFTSISGQGVLVPTGGSSFATYYQTIPTVIGQTYNVVGDVIPISPGGFFAIRKADDFVPSLNIAEITSTDGVGQTGSFVATATTTFIVLQVNNSGSVMGFDNISVKLA